MSFHVPNHYRLRNLPQAPQYNSTDADGHNGAFFIPGYSRRMRDLYVLASDGSGWEHVSVSVVDAPRQTPTWAEMCEVKRIFWDDDDVVVQFHPAKRDYVNQHPGTLHLWRPVGVTLPTPDPLMVGVR